jgi:flagellar L-ring protein precursor FlgH
MRNKIISVLILVFLILFSTNYSMAGSIWAKRDKNMRELYADDVAHQIGDILTIKISEDSRVDNKTKRNMKKEVDRSSSFNGELGIKTENHAILPNMPGFTMSATSSNELKGNSDYTDERSFIDSIAVVVMDVLPNGNLVVMGTRSRDIADDKQIIEISGIVKPSDIAFDNSVKSEQVADLRILTKNTGISEPYNRPGWLGILFDILWPF